MRAPKGIRRGFTIVELVVVMAVMGIMAAIAIPRMRVTPHQQVEGEARRVLQAIELARTRAYASRAAVQVAIGDSTITFYLDADRDSTFALSGDETTAFGPGGVVRAPTGLRFLQGDPGAAPGDSTTARAAGSVQLARIAPRGTPDPFGSSFTVYVTSDADDRATAAITMSPAGNVRYWTFHAGGGP